MTLTELFDRYDLHCLLRVAKGEVAQSTRNNVRLHMEKYVLPILGDRDVADLGRRDIKSLRDQLFQKRRSRNPEQGVLARVYVMRIISSLSMVLGYAVAEKLLTENVTSRHNQHVKVELTLAERRKARRKIKALSHAEREAFLAAAESSPMVARALLTLLVLAGLRISEAVVLRWDDLDLAGHYFRGTPTIRVERAWIKAVRAIGLPKHGITRRVEIQPLLLVALRQYRDWAERHGLSVAPDALVFPLPQTESAHGFPTGRWIRRHLAVVLQRAGVRRRLTPHCLRHTFATLLLIEHATVEYVQRQLGHSHPEVTQQRYGDWIPAGYPDTPALNPEIQLSPARASVVPPVCPYLLDIRRRSGRQRRAGG